MPYVVKTRLSPTVVALFTCPEHGVFELEVKREPNGDAPDMVEGCGIINDDCWGCGGQPSAPGAPDCKVCEGRAYAPCARECTWTPSAAVGCRVRRVEVVRGKWEPPERKTYLDTRKLGEGQDVSEFQAERKKVWAEQRRKRVKELLR